MRHLAIFLFILYVWLLPNKPVVEPTSAQVVQSSLQNGDAHQLSSRFAKTIELIIDAENVKFTSVEATHAALILRAFFRKYPPHQFRSVHRGSSDHLQYMIGAYETDGQTFAVYVLMRPTSDRRLLINALHFRKSQVQSRPIHY